MEYGVNDVARRCNQNNGTVPSEMPHVNELRLTIANHVACELRLKKILNKRRGGRRATRAPYTG
jgi:hypothetical protein